MSANNEVVIIERKDGFYIYENLCVDNDFKVTKDNLIEIKKDLRDAIIWAQKYCNEYPYVEYGYTIKLLEEKSK